MLSLLSHLGGIHSDEALSWFEMQQGRQQGATHGVEGQPPMEADSRSSVVHKSDSLKGALTILYTYLKRNNEQGLKQLKQCSFYKPEDYLMLDASTVRNLELVKNSNDGSSSHTLFSVIDRAVTAMGSRMLKKWLLRPLIKRERIEERLNAVTTFVHTSAVKKDLRDMFSAIGDLERTVGRVALRRARLYDYRALTDALAAIPDIKKQVMHCQNDAALIKSLAEKIDEFHELTELLQNAIVDDPGKDMLIKEGYNAELDRLRSLMHGGAQEIAALEEREIKRTGINSLKIRYNSVHGYGIEVTTPNLHLVPLDYLRIQTLANRERFTTQELKNLEHDLQRAQTEIAHIEKQLFEGVKQAVEEYVPQLKRLSFSLASLDALAALAEVAYTQKYVRPTFNEERQLLIQDGRHPVVEQRMQLARKLSRESAHTPQSVVSDHEDGGRQHAAQYIPNSVDLTPEGPLWLITGPNMGGKSTFLRQVALTVLMAQMGSYVPASRAHVSIVDRIFTRIGASDNVAEGKSTFLVEMEETALVCNHATPHSLIILDEVGRGTSTFDGLAIAQAVVEYIYITLKAHCLFATHYHELTDLCTSHPGIRAHHAASMQTNEGVVLLHKILPGVADGSFGLEVASMARLPQPIIARARDIIAHLAQHGHATGLQNMAPAVIPSENRPENLPEFKAAQRLLSEIESINVDEITPKQALDLMWHFKELVRDR